MIYSRALELAERFKSYLEPACSRIEIVGSVKRADKREVHDIEYLVILNGKHPRPEFGRPKEVHTTMLSKILADLEYQDLIRPAGNKADGDKLKRRAIKDTGEVNEFCMEIFIVNEKTWGIQNVIRTGPGLFSHRFVTPENIVFYDPDTQQSWNGFLPKRYKYVKGETSIMEGNKVLDLPEEKDVIALLGHGWIAPNERREFSLRPKP